MLWMLLAACSRGALEDLRAEIAALEDGLEAVEQDVEDLEAAAADTGAADTGDSAGADTEDTSPDETADTGPGDTGESPPPEPGLVFVDAHWDSNTRIWSVTVELSEDGDGVVIGSHLNIDNQMADLRGRCTSFTVDDGWTASTTFTVEVAWASGAQSCAQLLPEGIMPATGCDVLITRPTGC